MGKNTKVISTPNADAASGRISNRKEWYLVALVLVITFIVFSPALKNEYVSWDDDANITGNAHVKNPDAQGLKGIFTHTITGGYTPLTSLTFTIEYQVFGDKPGVFHFNNILLHLLCTLLVYILMRQLGMNLFISLTVMLLFGIHPMRVESVAWISERKDVLYGSFYLLSLISYIRFHKTKRTLFYTLAIVAFVFSLLSKIQAVTLPLAMVLIDYLFEKEFRVRQLINKIPFFALSLITGLAGIYILSHEGELETGTVLPFFQRIFIGTYSLCVYLIKAVWPYQLSAIYPYPEKLSILYYVSALMALVLAYLVYSFRSKKEIVFGSLFFFVTVVFMLQILGAGQAFLADRFTYIPYIGLFFLIAWALNSLYKAKWKPYVLILGLIYVAAMGTMSFNRTKIWKNTETLFTDVTDKHPEVPVAFNNLGVYFRDHNQNEKAITAYTRAIELTPAAHISYNNRGELYFSRGETDKALKDMNMAIQLKPDYVKALINRGALFGSKGDFDKAIIDLDKAILLDSKNLQAYSNRILVYYSKGDMEKAQADATAYINIKPDEADILNIRGLCYMKLNRNPEAMADFNAAININPRAGAYYKNRSSLYYNTGDKKSALNDAMKASSLGSKVDPAYLKILQSR